MESQALNLQPVERTCVQCGCTDSRACDGGCYWALLHEHTPTGVCSRCTAKAMEALRPEHLKKLLSEVLELIDC